VSVRIQSVEPLEKAASRETRDLTVFLRDAGPVKMLVPLLDKRGQGRVSFVVMQQDGEVEIRLQDRYAINARIQSAIRAVPGVVDAELV
jgi:DNA polymerase-3 subunit alpha